VFLATTVSCKLAEHGLNLFVVLDRVPHPLALVERLDELGGVAGALGRLARPVQQGVVARGDPSGPSRRSALRFARRTCL